MSKMREISIQRDSIICPAHWIVINPEQALYCHYAMVITYPVADTQYCAHCVYLHNYADLASCPDDVAASIVNLCMSICPCSTSSTDAIIGIYPIIDAADICIAPAHGAMIIRR